MSNVKPSFLYRGRIKVSREDFELLKKGRKKCTIRKGTVGVAGPEIYFTDGRAKLKVRITGVDTARCFGQLTEQDAIDEGFESIRDLIEDLKKYYRPFNPGQPMTVIYFEPVHEEQQPGLFG